jgi:hypothetical protein
MLFLLGVSSIGTARVNADLAKISRLDVQVPVMSQRDPLGGSGHALTEVVGARAASSSNHNWISFWEPGQSNWNTGELTTNEITSGRRIAAADSDASDAALTQPLLVPLPSAWSAGFSGLVVLGGVAVLRRVKRQMGAAR